MLILPRQQIDPIILNLETMPKTCVKINKQNVFLTPFIPSNILALPPHFF